MNLSFGSLGGKSSAPVRKNSIDHEPEEISPVKGSSGFSSKLGDYGRSISGMSKKVTSAASALVMSDDKEKSTPNKATVDRQKQVEQLVENFRLQCPQTHLGLVVAYSSTSLAPLIDNNVRFKWYRMGDTSEQFVQIDEGPRGWYPPTADDIGKKICANCEDTLDQGFCRYAEAGPIEADPLLSSMVETALENGRFEVKDVSVSFGIKAIDPCDNDNGGFNSTSAARALTTENNIFGHFNMSNPDRQSSLVSINSPFFKLTHNLTVEVDYQGIFLNGAMFVDEMDMSSHRGKRGLRIFSSPKLEISCTLPASIILVIPTIKNSNDSESSTPNNSNENDPSNESEIKVESNNDNNNNNEIITASNSTITKNNNEQENNESYIPYEWVGDTHGEIHEAFMDFIQSLPKNTTHFRICFACSDRMIRDALALTCTSLACFDKDIGARERLISLPWYSSDGIRHTAKVQTLSGNDLSNRLKTLEEENASLKRQQIELNLQLMEHEQNLLMVNNYSVNTRSISGDISSSSPEKELNHEDTPSTVERSRSGSVEVKDDGNAINIQQQQQINQLKTKQRDQEKMITTLKHKEMEYEKTILELNSHLKKSQTDIESQNTTINELKQKVVDSNTESNGMKVVAEKYQIEASELRDKLHKETSELNTKITHLTTDLNTKTKLCESQKEQLEELSTNISEKTQTITQLRDRILGLKTDVEDQKNIRHNLEKLLEDAKQELIDTVQKFETKQAEFNELESTVEQLKNENQKLSDELAILTNLKQELETRSISRHDYDELQNRLNSVEGEKNHFQQKAQSLGKELKRVLKSSENDLQSLRNDLSHQKETYDQLLSQYNELKNTMEEETRKRQEEEAQKSKGLFGRKKKETTPTPANTSTSK